MHTAEVTDDRCGVRVGGQATGPKRLKLSDEAMGMSYIVSATGSFCIRLTVSGTLHLGGTRRKTGFLKVKRLSREDRCEQRLKEQVDYECIIMGRVRVWGRYSWSFHTHRLLCPFSGHMD